MKLLLILAGLQNKKVAEFFISVLSKPTTDISVLESEIKIIGIKMFIIILGDATKACN